MNSKDMNVKTIIGKYGQYLGRKEDSIISFKGIPYAQSPIGSLRWKAPRKLEPSESIIHALDFGYSCVQPIDEIELASLRPQGEDCLTLNIWSRNTESEKKPVMVFIHGGGYIGGGSSDPLYDGKNFPKRNDVVMVSINYRCNVLGFMDIEEIGGAEYADSKNLGILDQICALEWIQENIHLFGGDPNNVTIFGESAGSGSVSLLMTSPRAKGLFNKVIAQSGGLIMYKSPEKAKEYAKDFVKHTGVSSMEELLSLSADEIRDACVRLMKAYGYKSEIMFAPVADGRIILENPYESIENGCASDIKLIVGTTEEELNYWKLYYDHFENEIPKFLEDQFKVMEPNLCEYKEINEEYLARKSALSLGQRYLDLSVELMFRIPSIKLAELHSKHADTWMYLFTWQSNIEGLGACHAIDVPFVFHSLDSESGLSFTGKNPPKKLADRTQDSWVAFARTGNPNHVGIPKWPKYDDFSRKTMIINEEWHVEEDPGKEDRLLLREIFEKKVSEGSI